MSKQVIFSGIQPTGNFHVGNYLGAIKNWVNLQNSGKYDCYFCIVDYHSLTGSLEPKQRKKQIMVSAAELFAIGLDPEKSTIFLQSDVPKHTELAWIFNTVTPMSELNRMTQFKDKSETQDKNINVGLFTYPVLQAADILLYHGDLVPVGQDQVQHIELTRDIARWFNKRYGKYFPEPKPMLTEVPKVMSLLDPTKKMSKSLGEGSVIELSDSPNTLAKKLKKAVTDSGEGKSPGAENLLMLLKNFAGEATFKNHETAYKRGDLKYSDLKTALADNITLYFGDFREKREELLTSGAKLEEMLSVGREKADKVAFQTIKKVREMVGIV
jgi:tryptophanyl-tRNA synthetase